MITHQSYCTHYSITSTKYAITSKKVLCLECVSVEVSYQRRQIHIVVTLEIGLHLGQETQFRTLSWMFERRPLRTVSKLQNEKWPSWKCAGQEDVSAYESMYTFWCTVYINTLMTHLCMTWNGNTEWVNLRPVELRKWNNIWFLGLSRSSVDYEWERSK
jgi:hypothetical protein